MSAWHADQQYRGSCPAAIIASANVFLLSASWGQAWGIGGIFGFIYGRAGVELGREVAKGVPWPDPPSPFAVIAGTSPLGLASPVSWLTSALHLLPGPSDGTVLVEETKLPAMSAFATVPAVHTAIINHPQTEHLILMFLRTGSC